MQRRRTALLTSLIALVILAIGYGIILNGIGDDEMSWFAIGFLAFFTIIALFIIVVSIADGFARTTEEISGVITAKTKDVRTMSRSSTMTDYIIEIDGVPRRVEINVFDRVRVGDHVKLTTGSVFHSVLDVEVTDRHAVDPSTEEFDVQSTIDHDGRRILVRRLLRSGIVRLVMAPAVGTALYAGCIIVAVSNDVQSSLIARLALPTSLLAYGLPAVLLFRYPVRLFLDWRSGAVFACTRIVTDVISANRLLRNDVEPAGIGSTDDMYIKAGEFFLPASHLVGRSMPSVGEAITIVVTQRARLVVGIA